MGCNCGGSIRKPPQQTRQQQPQAQRATHIARPPEKRSGGPGDPNGGYYARPRPAAPARR